MVLLPFPPVRRSIVTVTKLSVAQGTSEKFAKVKSTALMPCQSSTRPVVDSQPGAAGRSRSVPAR